MLYLINYCKCCNNRIWVCKIENEKVSKKFLNTILNKNYKIAPYLHEIFTKEYLQQIA